MPSILILAVSPTIIVSAVAVVIIAGMGFVIWSNTQKTQKALEEKDEIIAEKDKMIAAELAARAEGEQKLQLAVEQAEQAMEEAQYQAKEADAANQAKGTFLATMSHELRTPLNCILGLSEVLRATDPTEEQKEYLETIKSSVDALLAIIGNVLDFSKIEAGHLELNPERFNLGDLLNEIKKLFKVNATEKNLNFLCKLDSNTSVNIMCDRNYLRQILINLVGNAMKFTENGAITVNVSHERTAGNMDSPDSKKLFYEITISVADTGIGIPEDQRNRLFQPFHQLVGSETRKYEGTGLGLVICKRIVQAMGGEITYEPNKPNGSIFTVKMIVEGFAIKTAAKLKIEKLDSTMYKHALGESFYSHKILVADDNLLNRKVMTAMLKKMGHEADFVANGLEAIMYLKENTVDLILMDIMMPVLDGVEATKMIRDGEAGEHHKSIPIVALTAFALTSDKERFLSSGMDFYLTKPVEPAFLREVLTRMARSEENAG